MFLFYLFIFLDVTSDTETKISQDYGNNEVSEISDGTKEGTEETFQKTEGDQYFKYSLATNF